MKIRVLSCFLVINLLVSACGGTDAAKDAEDAVTEILDSVGSIEPIVENYPVINGYRMEPDADLSDADLSGADLSGVNLESADVTGADLTSANLEGANLSYADFTDANLSGANLSNANVQSANMWRANLSGAKMLGAKIEDWVLTAEQIDSLAVAPSTFVQP